MASSRSCDLSHWIPTLLPPLQFLCFLLVRQGPKTGRLWSPPGLEAKPQGVQLADPVICLGQVHRGGGAVRTRGSQVGVPGRAGREPPHGQRPRVLPRHGEACNTGAKPGHARGPGRRAAETGGRGAQVRQPAWAWAQETGQGLERGVCPLRCTCLCHPHCVSLCGGARGVCPVL